MKKFLQFIGWPIITGMLVAVILFQYQQIERLDESQRALSLSVDELRNGRPATPESHSGSMAGAVDNAAASVVSIHSTIREQIELPPADEVPPVFRDLLTDLPSERLWDSLGSGVAVAEGGYILTALHVIEGAEDIEVHFTDDTNNTVIARARQIGEDESTDLALLKIDTDETPPVIPRGSSDNVRVGDTVLTIGYPRRELMQQKSVSRGIVSALGIPRDGLPIVEYIQTDAAMNYGNSGGALINANGELIGINSFIYSESGGSDGIGFAVPVNKAMLIVDQLIEYGEVTPGYLGVVTGELLNETSSEEFFGRPDIRGLLIEQVNEDSPAEQAGIRAGDVMTQIDGRPIRSVISAIGQINRKPPGQTVVLTLFRNGESRDVSVELGTGTAQYRTRLSQ
ncbi:MAG: S1C family serine protease [Pseudomonadota bacterium]